jgi:taurine--2-oxoglutarate transaminase
LVAAIANIEVMRDQGIIINADRMGVVLSKLLRELKEKHPSVGDVRSIGLLGIIELVRDPETREPMAPFNSSSPEMEAVRIYLHEHGLYISVHWHTLLVLPPLIINEEQLNEGFAILDEALKIADKAVK